jgi:hypothetical protein
MPSEEAMIYIGLGLMTSILLIRNVPILGSLNSMDTPTVGCSKCSGKSQPLRLENLAGIDKKALSIAILKGY